MARHTSYRYGKQDNRFGTLSVAVIVVALVSVMGIKTLALYQKNQDCIQKEAVLEQQKAREEDRQKELEEYEAYTKTQEFIEDTAKSKLGMVYKGEIVFKEEK